MSHSSRLANGSLQEPLLGLIGTELSQYAPPGHEE